MLEQIKNIKPKFIGFSIFLDNFSDASFKLLLHLIKKQNPEIIIFVGGTTVEFNITRFKDRNVDIVFYGESEYPFETILKGWGNVDLTKIPNIAYNNTGEFIINKQEYMANLDNYMETYKYENPNMSVPGILLSRGCYFSCNHCVHKSRFKIYRDNNICKTRAEYYRRRTPEKSINLIKDYISHFNLDYVYLYDDFIFKDDNWYREFLELYISNIDKPIILTGVIRLITKELLELSKKLNIVCLTFGIESGNENIRKTVLNRNYTNDKIYETINLIKKYKNIKDIKTTNLIGIPGETNNNIYETIAINARLKIDSPNFHTLFPYNYTSIYKNTKHDIDKQLHKVGYNDLRSVYKNQNFSNNVIFKIIIMKDWFLNLYLSKETKDIYFPHVDNLLKTKIKDLSSQYLLETNKRLSNICKQLEIDHYFCDNFWHLPYLIKKKDSFNTPEFFKRFI